MQLRRRATVFALASLFALTIAAPAGAETPPLPPTASSTITLSGVGATFPAPIYTEWFAQYQNDYPKATVKFDYAATGSGSGIRAVSGSSPTATYGASDAAPSDSDLAGMTANGGVMVVPSVLGAVVIGYNLPGLKTASGSPAVLKLNATTVTKIFGGQIRKWNDPAIVATNPGVNLPNLAITPIHRSDSSGTTFVFTSYLYKNSYAWKVLLGAGGPTKSFSGWPVGIGVPRNSGVATRVFSTRGAIGYMEQSYAMSAGLPMARLRNSAGAYVAPSASTTTAAANAAVSQVPADFRAPAIINAPGYASYPIVSYTYLLLFKQYDTLGQDLGKQLVSYVYWALTSGQQYARPLGYAPLPGSIRNRALSALQTLTYRGSPIWTP